MRLNKNPKCNLSCECSPIDSRERLLQAHNRLAVAPGSCAKLSHNSRRLAIALGSCMRLLSSGNLSS